MRIFDGQLEKLINAGGVDKEVGLSYASNRTNLLLRLETQSGADTSSVTPSGKFQQALRTAAKGAPAPAPKPAPSEMDDLIESAMARSSLRSPSGRGCYQAFVEARKRFEAAAG
jgi:hypothetical protein